MSTAHSMNLSLCSQSSSPIHSLLYTISRTIKLIVFFTCFTIISVFILPIFLNCACLMLPTHSLITSQEIIMLFGSFYHSNYSVCCNSIFCMGWLMQDPDIYLYKFRSGTHGLNEELGIFLPLCPSIEVKSPQISG